MQERDLRQEWETPQNFFDVVNAEFGFQLDACASSKNSKCGAAYLGLDRDDPVFRDALAPEAQWCFPPTLTRVWCNPGFSNIGPWINKASAESMRSPDCVVVLMALVSPSTAWWRLALGHTSEIRLIGGRRVQLVPPEGIKKSSNSKEKCLIIFRATPPNLRQRILTWDWTKGLKIEC